MELEMILLITWLTVCLADKLKLILPVAVVVFLFLFVSFYFVFVPLQCDKSDFGALILVLLSITNIRFL